MAERPLVYIKIRIRHGEIYAMGPGKADLLQAIRDTRSIAAAGRQLGMSYWKTRHLLEEMRVSFRQPLVTATRGGEQGGGAALTDLGDEVLERFRAIERAAGVAIADLAEDFRTFLAD